MSRRPSSALLVSLALHAALGVALVRLVAMPGDGSRFFRWMQPTSAPVERVQFVAVPQRVAARTVAAPGRSGGDGRPARDRPRLVAPVAPPTSIAPPVMTAAPVADTVDAGYGPLVGGGGARRGVQPSYGSPEMWPGAADVRGPALSSSERLDSVLSVRLRRHQDSVSAVAATGPRREAGDWTGDVNGQKYGVDRKYIYLGKVRLPTAALALLPLNAQANPIAGARERQLNAWHAEIQQQSQRAMNQQEFKTAVRRIRERKERERAEQGSGAAGTTGTDGGAPQK